MPLSAVDLSFREQSEFFRRKRNIPTETWLDIYAQQHQYAFTVAGANRNAIVEDFRVALEKVVNDGGTLADFRKDFDDIVARHGWSYNGGRNWRSRVIYETNLNQTYNAGRYEQMLAVRESRPYWEYRHSDAVENPRPLHVSWDGLVLRWDDPWWQQHYPANGWGCQCRVFAIDEDDLEDMGKTGPDTAPQTVMVDREIGQRSPGGPRIVTVPEGVDPGFEYLPSQSRLHNQVPPNRKPSPGSAPRKAGAMPSIRSATVRPLSSSASSRDGIDLFLSQLGLSMGGPGIFRDVIGDAHVLGANMFKGYAGDYAQLPLLAATLNDPDEIFSYLEYDASTQKAVARKRYIARWLINNVVKMMVFDVGRDGWFEAEGDKQWRRGERIYTRDED